MMLSRAAPSSVHPRPPEVGSSAVGRPHRDDGIPSPDPFDRLRWTLLDNRWFVMLLAAATAARLYHFTRPPDDAHEWRQTQTLLMIASYDQGAPWLIPGGLWYGIHQLPAVLEFPAYSLAVYWLSRGVGLLTGARIASLAFSLTAIAVFDRICALTGHPRRRTATALFALAPITIFYGHAAQPDSLLLLLVLTAAYCALRAAGAFGWAVASALLLAMAAAIKPTALVTLAPPLAYLAWKHRQPGRYAFVVAVAGLAMASWAAFDRAVLLAANPGWYWVNSNPEWLFGTSLQRLSPHGYEILAGRAGMILLPPLTIGLALRAMGDRAGGAWWWWWAAGGLATVLVFINLNVVHFYYQLLLVPALAALAAAGAPAWPRRTIYRGAAVVALVTAAAIGCRELYVENPIYYRAGIALASIATPSRPVLALSSSGAQPWYPTVLYYSGHNGWALPLSSDARTIDRLPGPPACELVMVLDGPAPPTVPQGWREVVRTPQYVLGRRIGGGCPT